MPKDNRQQIVIDVDPKDAVIDASRFQQIAETLRRKNDVGSITIRKPSKWLEILFTLALTALLMMVILEATT